MNTQFFVSVALALIIACSSLFAAAEEIPLAIPAELVGKRGAHVNKSTQTITIYSAEGKILLEEICGTGALFAKKNKRTGELEQLDTPNSPKGKPYKIFKKDAKYVNSDGVPMPFSSFFYKGCAIHGNENFVSFKKRGIPQSGGCVRMSMETAEKVYALLDYDDLVVVTGSADDFMASLKLDHLFNVETAEKQEDLKFLIDLPNPTKEQIAQAREAWIKADLLVEDPKGSKRRSEMFIRYPSMPETTRMSFLKFEKMILTKEEQARRVRLACPGVELRD